MQADDRWYVWVPTAGLDAVRAMGATIGSQADDGRWLVKLRASKQSDIRPLPQGSTVITRPDNERAARVLASVRAEVEARVLASVRAEVEARTVNVRAAQGEP